MVAPVLCYWHSLATVPNVTSMMKIVLKVEIYDDRSKKNAMRLVSGLPGVDSISVNMNDGTLIIIGDIEARVVVRRLRKLCYADILSVGPAKKEEKKDKPKEKGESSK